MSIVQHAKHLEYKDVDSPVGQIRLISGAKGLSALIWEAEDYQRTKLIDPERNDASPLLRLAERQLEEYFNNRRRSFDVPLDPEGTIFQKKVWAAVPESGNDDALALLPVQLERRRKSLKS